MNFELSEEQTMLKETVTRFVQDNYDPARRRELSETSIGFSRENWQLFADMGWLALPFGEDVGGLGGSQIDTNVLMEEFGTGLVLEPVLSTLFLGGKLVEKLGTKAQKEALLSKVIEGQMLLALAYSEPQSRFEINNVETTATPTDDGFVLNGTKSAVIHAASADKIIISCRTSGASRSRPGISLFLVDIDTKGMVRKDYRLVDGARASDLELTAVEVNSEALLGTLDEAFEPLEQTIDLAICAICAEAVGAMRRVNDITKDYVATRKQFGNAIGSNQVIQHRLVDMHIAAEESKALSDISAMRADQQNQDLPKNASAAKAKVGECARFVGAQGIQLHGGIGMTNEYPIGHYFKRLMAIDILFGDQSYHLKRFAACA